MKGHQRVAQGKREAATDVPSCAALGQRSHQFYPLPQHVFCVGGEGEGEGADRADQPSSRFVRTKNGISHEAREWASTHAPLSQLLPRIAQKGRRFGGEE